MPKSRIEITYAGQVHDRTRALFTGDIRVEGVNLDYRQMPLADLFWRQAKYAEFDSSEYSFGAHLASVEDPACRLLAIPVFPSRTFRHAAIYVSSDAGIDKPEDLNGRRIGTPEWSITAALWVRGILAEHYGLDLRSVHWRTGGLEQPGYQERLQIRPPAGLDLAAIADGDTLNGLLVGGELDAVISTFPPSAFNDDDPRIRRLFADTRGAEQAYFRQSGIFPIMHVVVIKRELVERFPWLANNLRAAFEQARELAAPRLLDNAFCTTSLAWESSYAEQERALMGDAFRYGAEENRKPLEALCRYGYEQGFTQRLLAVEELFIPSTVTGARV